MQQMGCAGSAVEPRPSVTVIDADRSLAPRQGFTAQPDEKLVVSVMEPGTNKRQAYRAIRRAPLRKEAGQDTWHQFSTSAPSPRRNPLTTDADGITDLLSTPRSLSVETHKGPNHDAGGPSATRLPLHPSPPSAMDVLDQRFLRLPHHNTPRSIGSHENTHQTELGDKMLVPVILPKPEMDLSPRSYCYTARSLTYSHERGHLTPNRGFQVENLGFLTPRSHIKLPPIRRGAAASGASSRWSKGVPDFRPELAIVLVRDEGSSPIDSP
jgi:hypothetical protein